RARPRPADRRALLRAARGPGRRARRPPRRRRDLGRCGAASGPTAWRDAGARGGPPAHPRPPPPPRLRPRALGGRGAAHAAARAHARPMAVAVGANGTPLVAVAEQPWRPGTRSVLAAASGVLLAAAFPARDLEPLAWIGGWFFIGFPWAALGYSQ